MTGLNVLAILAAVVAAFLLSGGYYAALSSRMARLNPVYAGDGRPAAAVAAVELVRNLAVTLVVAGIAAGLGLAGLGQAVLLALALWVAFPAVLLAGSVFHEQVPPLLAAIHAGDWLLKLIAVTAIVTLWR